MEVLSLGQHPSFFGMPSMHKSISNENIQAALKARKRTKAVTLLGGNLAVLEETGRKEKKLIKYYTCRETLPDPNTRRGGNTLPWYQISKTTLEKLKELKKEMPEKEELKVEEIILLYWTRDQRSHSAAFALDKVSTQWKKEGNVSKKYRLNYQRSEDGNTKSAFTCKLEDGEKSIMNDDGMRQIAKDVDVG